MKEINLVLDRRETRKSWGFYVSQKEKKLTSLILKNKDKKKEEKRRDDFYYVYLSVIIIYGIFIYPHSYIFGKIKRTSNFAS